MMRKRGAWKRGCALGLTIAIVVSNAPVVALADETTNNAVDSSEVLEENTGEQPEEDVTEESDQKDAEEAVSPKGEEFQEDGDVFEEQKDDQQDTEIPETEILPEDEDISEETEDSENVETPVSTPSEVPSGNKQPEQMRPMKVANEAMPITDDLQDVEEPFKIFSSTTDDGLIEFLNEYVAGDPDYSGDWYYRGGLFNRWINVKGDRGGTSLLNSDKDGEVTVGIEPNRIGTPQKTATITIKRTASIKYNYIEDAKSLIDVDNSDIADSFKLGTEAAITITPVNGYEPKVSVDGTAVDAIIDGGAYTFVLSDYIEDDMTVEISCDQIENAETVGIVKDENVTVTYNNASVTDQVTLTGENRRIHIAPASGYAIASINHDTLDGQTFSEGALDYEIPEETESLEIKTVKLDLVVKDGNINWIDGDTVDDGTAEAIINAMVDFDQSTPDIYRDNLTVEYLAGRSILPSRDVYKELTYTPSSSELTLHAFGKKGLLESDKDQETIRITYSGTDRYPGFSVTGTVTLKDNRQNVEIRYLDESEAKITYTSDEETFKRAVYDNIITGLKTADGAVIDKASLNYEDFEISVPKDLIFITNLNVGTKTITVKFKGNALYSPCEAEITLEIVKASSSVSVGDLRTITYGDAIPDDFVVTSPKGLGTITFYAGIDSSFSGTVMIDTDVAGIDIPLIGEVNLTTLFQNAFPNGLSLDQFLELKDTDAVQTLLKALNTVGIETDQFIKVLEAIDQYLPDTVTGFTIQFGTPKKAGFYGAVAMVADRNHNSSFDVGSLIIVPKTEGVSLQWNHEFEKDPLGVEVLEFNDRPVDENGDITDAGYELFGAKLMSGSEEAENEIDYWYTGVSNSGTVYAQSEPILEPGTYLQKAGIKRLGDELAWPILRTYRVERSDSLIRFATDNGDEVVNPTLTYNGEPQGIEASVYYGADFGKKCDQENVTIRYNGSEELPINAGEYEVKAYFAGDAWHKDAATQTRTLTIEKADPTITPGDSVTVEYDGQAHEAQYTVNGADETAVSVQYYDADGNLIEGAPVAAGTYRAEIMVAETANWNSATLTVDGAVVITAPEFNSYQITFNVGEGSWTEEGFGAERTWTLNSDTPDVTYEVPEVVAPAGKKFTGWKSENGQILDAGSTYTYLSYDLLGEANIIFMAQYEEVPAVERKVTVNFTVDPEKGAFEGTEATTITRADLPEFSEEQYEIPTVVAKDGWKFVGWKGQGADEINWSADAKTFGVSGLAFFAEGSTVGYASVEAVFEQVEEPVDPEEFNTYQITFDAGEGTWADAGNEAEVLTWTLNRGEVTDYHAPEVVAPTGKRFTGWLSDNGQVLDDKAEFSFESYELLEAETINFTAQYEDVEEETEERTVNVYFSLDSEKGSFPDYDPSTVVSFENLAEFSAEQYEIPTVVAKDGWKFVGWKGQGADVIEWGADARSFGVTGLAFFEEGSTVGYASIEAVFEQVEEPQPEPEKDVDAKVTVQFTDAEGNVLGEVELIKTGKEGETATFTTADIAEKLPEGYKFADLNWTATVPYGQDGGVVKVIVERTEVPTPTPQRLTSTVTIDFVYGTEVMGSQVLYRTGDEGETFMVTREDVEADAVPNGYYVLSNGYFADTEVVYGENAALQVRIARTGSGDRTIGTSGSGNSGRSLSNGNWQQNETGWWYSYTNGSYAKSGWYTLEWQGKIDWYFFDDNGYLVSGWLDNNGNRYYLHDVHDGTFGRMYTGWNKIGDQWYLFNDNTTEGVYGAFIADAEVPEGLN